MAPKKEFEGLVVRAAKGRAAATHLLFLGLIKLVVIASDAFLGKAIRTTRNDRK